MTDADYQDLIRRIESLERERTRYRVVLVVLFLIAVAAFVLSCAPRTTVVQAAERPAPPPARVQRVSGNSVVTVTGDGAINRMTFDDLEVTVSVRELK